MTARLYPWPTYPEPLPVKAEVAVDGAGVPIRLIDNAHRRIELSHLSAPWERIEVTLTVEQPHAELGPDAVVAHALLACVGTASRIPTVLSSVEDGWRGVLHLHREEVSGAGTLEAVVTANVQVPGDEELVPSRLVGRSEPWIIRFDSQHGPPGHSRSPMKTIWEDFGDPGPGTSAELSRVHQALSYCDVVPAEPVLYLNTAVAGLQGLLDDTKATGRRKQVQQHLGAGIALDAVLALLDAAIHQVPPLESEDEPSALALPAPLTATLQTIVEECDDFTDLADVVRRVAAAKGKSDDDEMSRIRGLLRSTAQAYVGSRRSAEALIKGVADD